MGTDVKGTKNDWNIAFRGLLLQAKVHKVEFTWEVRSLLIHLADVQATEYAMERKIQDALHRATLRGLEEHEE